MKPTTIPLFGPMAWPGPEPKLDTADSIFEWIEPFLRDAGITEFEPLGGHERLYFIPGGGYFKIDVRVNQCQS